MEMIRGDAREATGFHEADQLDQGLTNPIDGPDQYLVDLTTVDRVNQRQFAWGVDPSSLWPDSR